MPIVTIQPARESFGPGGELLRQLMTLARLQPDWFLSKNSSDYSIRPLRFTSLWARSLRTSC
jgi:hypothetical protein